MKKFWMKIEETYDGSQLRPHFNYFKNQTLGNSIVSWKGACNIPWENMLDGEDLLARSPIYSEMMLHFVIEVFERSLFSGVWMQRMFAQIVIETLLSSQTSIRANENPKYLRRGDDIYFISPSQQGNVLKKLSVSIASLSTVSVLIHFGINISSQNTPVPTLGLNDLGITDVQTFANECMDRWIKEFDSSSEAVVKVRPCL